MYKCPCGFETENGHKYAGHFTYNKGSPHQKIGWVDDETGEIYPKRPRPSKAGAPPPPPEVRVSRPTVEKKETIPPVGVQGNPIILDFGSEKVPFDRGKMWDALQLYRDMVERDIIHEDFASVCRDGIGLLWRILVISPGVEGEKVVLEEV